MELLNQTLTFTPQDITPKPETYSTKGWPARLRNAYLAKWAMENPQPRRWIISQRCSPRFLRRRPGTATFRPPGEFFQCGTDAQSHG